VPEPRAQGLWILERCQNERFPYRLQITRGAIPWLVLRVQDRWPAANRNIFCLREKEAPEPGEVVEEMERIPLTAMQTRGKRLSVVLARGTYKRCDFLFLTKPYKDRPGEQYEQIYWMTQRSMQQRRSQARLVSTGSRQGFTVRIASDEKYPWSFANAATERGKLPVGDYALMRDGTIAAVVERKTFENLLGDLSLTPVLHQRVLELAAYEHSALVVEAPYEDFLTPKKVHHLNATFCAAAIAELYALHPQLQIVFCSNRKTANEWTRNYFGAVWNLLEEQPAKEAEG